MPLMFQEKMRRGSSDGLDDCATPPSSGGSWMVLDTGSNSTIENLSPVDGKIRLLFVGGGLMERFIAAPPADWE
jgi:hypothetical protein